MVDGIGGDDHQMWLVAGICQQSVRQVADDAEVRAESQPQRLLCWKSLGHIRPNIAELLGDRVMGLSLKWGHHFGA